MSTTSGASTRHWRIDNRLQLASTDSTGPSLAAEINRFDPPSTQHLVDDLQFTKVTKDQLGYFEADATLTTRCGQTREAILTIFCMKIPKDLLYDFQPSAAHSFIDLGPRFANPWRAYGALAENNLPLYHQLQREW